MTLNRYAYVKNSPLNYADPSGHDAYIYEKDGNYYIEPDNKWYNISENVVGLIPFGDTFARWLNETIYGWDYIEDDTDMWTAAGAGVTVIGLRETIENHSEITSTAMRSAKITKVAGAAGTVITFITFGGTFIDNGPQISQATVDLYREYLSAIPDKEILEQRYRLLYLLVGTAMEKGAITYCTEKWYDEDAFLIVPGSTQISDQDKFQEAMDEIGYTPEDVIKWFPVNEKR